MHAPRSTPTPLVGRTEQLQRLSRAAARPPCVIVITGEAGIGKTRMVHEVLRIPALTDLPHLIGQCAEMAETPALAPVIAALACLPAGALREVPALAGALTPVLPALAGVLPAPLPPLGYARAECHRMLRAAYALLGSTRPAVLVLEDIHWADASTREFLRLLTTSLPAHLTVILTGRDDFSATQTHPLAGSWLSGAHVHEVRLAPLTPGETGDLAARLMGADHTSERFAERLHRRTAGIPFAIEEVIRLITDDDGDDLTVDGTVIEQAGLPAPVRRVFLERLAPLSEQARDVVVAAAVAARPVTVDLLADITGLSESDIRRAVSMALEHGALHPSEGATLDFRHPLARQSAYEAISEFERSPLHLRAAKAVLAHVSPPPLTQIAHHYRQAGRTRAYLRYTEAAGDRANAHGDTSTATCHYLTALNDHPSARARIRLGTKLAKAALSAMPEDAIIPALRRILTEDDPSRAAAGELRLYLGTLMRNQAGLGLGGLAEIARAAEDLTETAPELAARAMSAIAIPSIQGWPLTQHLAWLERAEALIPRIADPVQRTAIAANRATALMFTGDPEAWNAAAALPATASSPAEEIQLARACVNLAHATTALGHPAAAHDYLARADATLERNGIPYLEGLAETAHLLLAWTTGHWEGLTERAQRAALLYCDIRDLTAEVLLVRGLLALHQQGDSAAARLDLLGAARTAQLDTGIVLPAAAAALARIHLAADRPDHANAATTETLDHIRRTGGWIWATELAPIAVEALTRTGWHPQARQLVEDFAAGIEGRHAPAATASLLTCRAHLSEADRRPDAAATLFLRAAQAWTRAGRPLETGHALQGAARCSLPADHQRGQELSNQAQELYERIGAKWDASNYHRLLRRQGLTPANKRGPVGYGDSLSPREQAAALLAAQGLSNRAIADQLNISTRTAEHHIAKALRKLGIDSRTHLAAALATPSKPETTE
ncbi:AAA family ATPase [Streptomyces sp. NPDC051555]|uniref:helix-turn-helix transcriptional regulator n=1 Tax=Streptomyces sp. NPDC051555 TaxID=3365657 RepID=UPI00378E408E